jgi:Poly(hydroxyalcanoate) granule associated protein (phasin)
MAAKNGKVHATKPTQLETNNVREFSRKAALAYVGAFGVAADEVGSLFEKFVTRGEQMQHDARKMVKQNEKQVRQFAAQVQKEQKATVARANKTVKKAVKRVEEAIA